MRGREKSVRDERMGGRRELGEWALGTVRFAVAAFSLSPRYYLELFMMNLQSFYYYLFSCPLIYFCSNFHLSIQIEI